MKLRNEAPAKQADEKTPWVERETLVEASPDEVWEALTDEDRLEEWLAPDVELDPTEGGEIAVRDGDGRAQRHRRDRGGGREIRLHLVAARRGRELRRVHDRGAARRQPGDGRRDANTFGGHEHRRRITAMAAGGWGPRLARLQRVNALRARRLRAPAHRQVDSVFGALADPTRRRVVETLARGGTVTASGLAEQLPITRQAVAKHLSALRGADLVTSTRVGRETRYELRPQPLDEAAQWIQTVSAEWDDRLDSLRRSIEKRRWRAPSRIGAWPKRPSRRRSTSRSCSGSRRPGCRSTAPTSRVPCSSRRPPSTR